MREVLLFHAEPKEEDQDDHEAEVQSRDKSEMQEGARPEENILVDVELHLVRPVPVFLHCHLGFKKMEINIERTNAFRQFNHLENRQMASNLTGIKFMNYLFLGK